ncbi:MAG: hypothetical protein IJB24_02625 [Clostridia bacterium]|nr:hypothetical protein [Clostridia bacterium]MBQ4601732.1 hypothetical protein [Clostridia bacterium]
MKIIIENLFKMSLTASVVILAILLARLFMRRCPKIYSYLLWSIAGIRLCIPFSLESRLSIFNLFNKTETQIQSTVGAPVGNAVTAEPADPYKLIGIIWLAGMLALIIYGIFTYYRLQHKLKVSFPMGDGVYGVEGLSSPFVMGFFDPKIYIPLGLDKETESYVLMHERTHLKRGDHLIKLLAFGLLCVHWFNPFCWLAFIFMSRDMEMSCDERVLGSGDISTDYSTALLSFAQNKRFPSPGPLCFGEVSVKRRIKNILSWKKPAFFITVISVILCVTVFVVCACDPVEDELPEPTETKTEEVEAKVPDTSADTSADTTTADTTTADTTTEDTTVETTTVETATSVTTTAPLETTKAPETTADTGRNVPIGKVIVPETEPAIDDSMQASFDQSLKEHEEYIRESMRKDLEEWYENNPTPDTTTYYPYDKPLKGTIVIFPEPGQTPGFNYP